MEPGDPDSWARAHLGAGTLAQLHGDLEPARRHLEVAVATLRAGDHHHLTLAAIHNLGMAAINLGDYEVGAELIAEEFAVAEARGDLASMAFASSQLAALANANGDIDNARRLLQAAVQHAEKLGSIEMVANTLTTAALEALFVDDLDLAEQFSSRLSQLGRVPSAPGRHEVVAALVLGRKGDSERAIAKLKAVWAAEFRKLADYRSIAVVMVPVIVELAGLELAAGSAEKAATLLGGSEPLLRGRKRLPHEQRVFDRHRAKVIEAVSADVYEAAFQRGVGFTFDELLDFAIA